MIFEIFEVGIWYVAKYECESLLCTPPKQEVDVEFFVSRWNFGRIDVLKNSTISKFGSSASPQKKKENIPRSKAFFLPILLNFPSEIEAKVKKILAESRQQRILRGNARSSQSRGGKEKRKKPSEKGGPFET